MLLRLFNCSDWQKQIIEKLAKEEEEEGKVVISPTFTANRYVVTNYGIQQPWLTFLFLSYHLKQLALVKKLLGALKYRQEWKVICKFKLSLKLN